MMKTNLKIHFASFLFILTWSAEAQEIEFIPDLSKVNNSSNWVAFNRKPKFNDGVSLDGLPGNGLLYINDFEFINGKIELDIKGKDDPGRSFVGIAFHGLNDSTYEAIYFRPFNFKNPERKNHSVQYISMPQNDWYKLREQHPGVYESTIQPVPDPDNWFHATVIINYPEVKVFVNNSDDPSLIIRKISIRNTGWVGLWVGNNSEGRFKNLKITSK
jgi:hypothetical protein